MYVTQFLLKEMQNNSHFLTSLEPHYSFDALGAQATLTTGLKAIRKYGTFYNIAV